jgi:hypothetical protein
MLGGSSFTLLIARSLTRSPFFTIRARAPRCSTPHT